LAISTEYVVSFILDSSFLEPMSSDFGTSMPIKSEEESIQSIGVGMWLSSALVATLSIVASAPMSVQRSGQAPVAEFERVVYCGLGWRLVVYDSGDAHQQVEDTCTQSRSYSRRFRFPQKELDALRAAILEARFQELPDEVYAGTVVPDEDALVISVRNGGTTKRVLARGLERATSDEARRFQMVWDAMTRVVPDPALTHDRK
jgi:hypothetical protein